MTNALKISVILPTHDPRLDHFTSTLTSLQEQTLATENWELLVIDNASKAPLPTHPVIEGQTSTQCRLIRENKLGLTAARRCGIQHAEGDILIFVDDDNVLDSHYLETALNLMTEQPELGACGGKVIPLFESSPPQWIEEFAPLLACQDFGKEPILSGPFVGNYPKHAPVGAGLVLRTASARSWTESNSTCITDRSGAELSSGGDNDIILHILKSGKWIGWFPSLKLDHLIPEARTEPAYLARLNEGIQKSWMQLNTLHGINPWPPISAWSLPLRTLKAWITHQGWNYPAGYIRWKGACGHFKGRVRTVHYTMRLGKVLYHLWHRPLSAVRTSIAAGGPFEQWQTKRGMIEMERSVEHLVPLPKPDDSSPELHFLTGSKFWYQTAFCIASWQQATGDRPSSHLYDDGTLTSHQVQKLIRLLPGTVIHRIDDIQHRLDTKLPLSCFPRLRDLWSTYPNIRKLTDVHLGSSGWKLVLDSDILFFQSPELLQKWCAQPDRPLHAIDSEESYGYPRPAMEALCGNSIPRKVNVGICGLCSHQIDWNQLEFWCNSLIKQYGKHYYLEQALVAMMVAGHECSIAPVEQYITLPTMPEAIKCRAIMHHYVADSKKWYFRNNWKHFTANQHGA